MSLFPVVGQAQSSPADSARRLASRADSAFSQGTEEALGRAFDLRGQAAALFAAVGDARNQGVQLNGMGRIAYTFGQLDTALVYFRQAAAVRIVAHDSAGYGRTMSNMGAVFGDKGEVDSAITYLRVARTIARELKNRDDESAPVGNLGGLYYQLRQLDSALAYMQEALRIYREVKDTEGEGQTLNNLANLYSDLGRPDTAFVMYRAALRLANTLGDRSLRANALMNIGDLFHLQGVEDSALTYDRRALAEVIALGDKRSQALLLQNMGIVYSELGQYDSALVRFRRGLVLARESGDVPLEAKILSNLGVVWHRLGEADTALVYHHLALPLRRAVQDRRGEGRDLLNIAGILVNGPHRDSAAVLARQGLRTLEEADDRGGQAAMRGVLALYHEFREEYDSALTWLTEDVRIAREIGDRREEGEALAQTAHVLVNAGRLAQASAYYDTAAVVTASISRRAGEDFNRVSYAERGQSMFDDWVRTWLMRRDAEHSEDAILAALAAHERGRAQALLDLMRDSSRSSRAPLDLVTDGVSLIAAATRDDAAVISYALVGDSVLIWSARRGTPVRLQIVPVARDSLTNAIVDLRRALGADNATLLATRSGPTADAAGVARSRGVQTGRVSDWEASARRLRDIIFPPALQDAIKGVNLLILAPSGSLALVPFAALPRADSGGTLGDAVAIQYVPSLGIFRALQESGTQRSPGSVRTRPLVVGNPTMPRLRAGSELRGVLVPLPSAEREARTVAALLGGTALTNGLATEASVRRRLASASVIHLATHGIAFSSRSEARHSFVALAPGQGHDGMLTVGEILDDPLLRLRAELVVLSACQTGLGTPSEAEGTIGFQRAFLARGARAVLVSLWDVSDAATQLLMQRFYAYWLGSNASMSAAEALRRAQNDVRQTPRLSHPRYWAAFQVVGAPN